MPLAKFHHWLTRKRLTSELCACQHDLVLGQRHLDQVCRSLPVRRTGQTHLGVAEGLWPVRRTCRSLNDIECWVSQTGKFLNRKGAKDAEIQPIASFLCAAVVALKMPKAYLMKH